MKEVFSVNMTKSKEFEGKEITSIRIEARVLRCIEYDGEVLIGDDEPDKNLIGFISIKRLRLHKENCIGDKVYECDITPCANCEQNLYKFINDRRVFERLIKEMVELMGRTDKDEASLEFGFYCGISNIKAHILQAMELEMESKLKEFSKDRFFKKEEAIVRAYKGCDTDE